MKKKKRKKGRRGGFCLRSRAFISKNDKVNDGTIISQADKHKGLMEIEGAEMNKADWMMAQTHIESTPFWAKGSRDYSLAHSLTGPSTCLKVPLRTLPQSFIRTTLPIRIIGTGTQQLDQSKRHSLRLLPLHPSDSACVCM